MAIMNVLTIKHKHFNPHISIFHIYELSITSLCYRAQCAPPPASWKKIKRKMIYATRNKFCMILVLLTLVRWPR